MSEINPNGPVEELVDEGDAPELGGALKAIGRRHVDLRKQEVLKLKVPGYEDLMQIEYKLLPEAEMDKLEARVAAVKDKGVVGEWETEADMLVSLCNRIQVREAADAPWQVLEDGNGPIRFGNAFAKVMEEAAGIRISPGRARDAVIDFFSPRKDPSDPSSPRQFPNAMDRHITAIQAWNRGLTDRIAKDLLGE